MITSCTESARHDPETGKEVTPRLVAVKTCSAARADAEPTPTEDEPKPKHPRLDVGAANDKNVAEPSTTPQHAEHPKNAAPLRRRRHQQQHHVWVCPRATVNADGKALKMSVQ